jgi:hypothetical protein
MMIHGSSRHSIVRVSLDQPEEELSPKALELLLPHKGFNRKPRLWYRLAASPRLSFPELNNSTSSTTMLCQLLGTT